MPSPIELVIRISSQTASAVSGMGSATTAADKFKAGAKAAGAAALAVGGALIALGKDAADAASRQEQAFGSLQSVYGETSQQVEDLAKTAARSTGLSASEYAEMSAKLGASLKNMGLETDAAAESSKELITLGADLSAAFGGSSADAVAALGSALRGEADPAERYGLALSQTAINAELAAQGQDKLTGAALQQAKAAAIMSLATKQAGGAIGQFARESEGAAGTSQIAAAEFENSKAALGQALLPVVVEISKKFSEFSNFLMQNQQAVKTVALVIAGLVAGVLVLNGVLYIWSGLQKVVTAAQWLWNAAISANPITLIILAIVAFVAAIAILWDKSEGFRNFIIGAWDAIKAAGLAVWEAIKVAIDTVLEFVKGKASAFLDFILGIWNTVKSVVTGVWDSIKSAASSVWSGITNIVSGAVNGITSVIQTIIGIASGIWNTVSSGAKAGWDLIKRYIVEPLQSAYDWITGVFGSIGTFFSNLWQGIVDTAGNILGGIGRVADNAFKGVSNVVKGVINGVLSFINNTVIFGINKLIDGANLVPFVNIPHLKNIPLIASLGGETGGLRSAFVPGTGGQSYSNDYSMSVTITGAIDPDASARRIEELLVRRQRRIGMVRIGGQG